MLADDAVQIEEVRRHGINLLVRERAGLIERLRPVDIAPQRRGVRPIAANGLDGFVRGQRAAAADERTVFPIVPVRAMTRGAACGVNRLADRSRAASRRETL